MMDIEAANSNDKPVSEFNGWKNQNTENFPVGSFLIRADLRRHVFAYYAFARAADNISDDPLMEASVKIAKLDAFGKCLTTPGDRSVSEAVALRDSLKETGVPAQHALDLLTAFKRDCTQLRYRDWYDLMDYCNCSANPVGRYMLALHGVGKEAWAANDALCSALQVLNHVQDCADDYREMDRVYIPQDMLARHGGLTGDLAKDKSTPGLQAALQEMLDNTKLLIDEARKFPGQIPDAHLKMETSVICVVAERLLALLRKRDPLCDNVKLSRLSKMGAAVTGIIRAWL